MNALEPGLDHDALETTDDGFLGGELQVLQPRRGYRAGLEAVFLAAAVPASSGDTALEAGCGVGVASLCLVKRVEGARITGVELEPSLVDLARENAQRNGLGETAQFRVCDIRGGTDGTSVGQNSRAHVFANPPFFTADSARRSDDALKNRAHICERRDLDAWVRFLVSVAEPGGSVTLIYRAEGLGDLLHLLNRRVGQCRILPLYPRASQPASRVIIQGQKGSKAPASLLRGVVLHDDGDGYTPEAQNVLRHGEALHLM
jgi:tRNA1(Val) A37 N6-methylase TrmN6